MNGIFFFYFLFFGVSLCVFFLGLEPNTCMLFLQHHTFILVKSCRFDFSTRYIYIYIYVQVFNYKLLSKKQYASNPRCHTQLREEPLACSALRNHRPDVREDILFG